MKTIKQEAANEFMQNGGATKHSPPSQHIHLMEEIRQ
jgi:hypothetical protein